MKIFNMGRRDKGMERDYVGRFTSFKRKMYWFVKRVVFGFSMIVLLAVVYALGATTNPVVKAEVLPAGLPPILAKIAKCESPNGHWKNGQVVINLNTNGTYDQGAYQINSVWNKKATELGFNLAVEQDNQKMAEWIYANRGTGDWASSQNCWKK